MASARPHPVVEVEVACRDNYNGCKRIRQDAGTAGDQIVEVTVGGGAIKAVMNGHQKLLSIISPDVVDPDDVEMLQDMIVAS
jgi:DNA-binding protein YbaB